MSLIFVSAVTSEFGDYREPIRKALGSPTVAVKTQEDLSPHGGATLIKLNEYVRQASLVVQLVGDVPGKIAPRAEVEAIKRELPDIAARLPSIADVLAQGGPSLSYTQWEAFLALYHLKRLLIFRAAPDVRRAADCRPTDAMRQAQQEYLDRLEGLNKFPERDLFRSDLELVNCLLKSVDVTNLRAGLADAGVPVRLDPLPPVASPATVRHRDGLPGFRREAMRRAPSWRLLADGAYFPQADRVSAFSSDLEAWLADAQNSLRQPVYWIGGRSGDGKSVLLLQVVADLMQRQPGVWTALKLFDPGDLPAAIEKVSRGAGRVLLVADDLHKVADVDDFVRRMHDVLERIDSLPIVIACGPTPEYLRFSKETAGVLSFRSKQVPALDDPQRVGMAEWLGLATKPGLSSSDHLVEFLFELDVEEPIQGFARNFAERLKKRGALETATKILAANSLDVVASADLLEGNADSFIRRLDRGDQRHFDFDRLLVSARPGIVFRHTLIAWRILRHWLDEPDQGKTLERRFADALVPSLRHAEGELEARPIGYAVFTRGLDLLDQHGVPLDINAVAAALMDALSATPKPLVAVIWPYLVGSRVGRYLPDVQRVWALLPVVCLSTEVSARDRGGVAARYLAALARAGTVTEDGQSFVRGVLFARENCEMAGPSVVYLAACKEGAALGWDAWAEEWLAAYPDSSSLPPLAQWLCARPHVGLGIAEKLLAWIGDPPRDAPGDSAVFESLLAALDKFPVVSAVIAERALTWIGNPPADKLGVNRVFAALLATLERFPDKSTVIVERALTWIGDPPQDKQGTNKVFSSLLAALDRFPAESAGIAERALSWIGDPPQDKPGVSLVFGGLLAALEKFPDKSAVVAERALKWIGDPPQNKQGVSQVFDSLLAALHRLPDMSVAIAERALTWIGDPPQDRQGTNKVFESLLGALESLPDKSAIIAERALTWIGDPPKDRHGANNVFEALLAALDRFPTKSAIIAERALAWIGDSPRDKQGLSSVFSSLLAAREHHPDKLVAIAERALAWIGDPPRRTSSTAPTVSSLVSAQEQLPEDLRERVLRRATDWLETNAKSEAAPNVAAGLCFAAKDDPKVRSTLVDWALAARTPGALRKFLSMFFRFCGPEDKLLAIAKSLLQEGGSAGRRADLLCGLVQAYPHEPEIAALALAHLSAPRPPLGPEICRYWLRHASAPHEIVRHFLGLSGGVSLMVKWSPVVGCVQEAFARNISEVLRALPELDEKERAATLLRLRYGISRRAEAAKALLAQLEEWPAQYSGVLFRSLLESTIPTAEFAPRLYLSLERRDMAPDQYRETLMGLAARSIRDAELVAGLPANVRRRVDEMAARLRSAELSKAFG